MAKIQRPILLIRDVFKKLNFHPEDKRIPKRALLRFVHFVEELNDPRLEGLVSYPLTHILFISFLAVLSGASTWVDIGIFAERKLRYIKKFLRGYKRAPSHDTFRRVLGLIEPEQFSAAVTAFLIENLGSIKKALNINDYGYQLISVDGKEARGTGRKYNSNEKISDLQTLNIYDVSNAICLAGIPIDKKTNEIPTAQKYLAEMQLKKCIVTFGVMNTQKETVHVIVSRSGDYVGGLKGNHGIFRDEVKLYFDEQTLAFIRKNKNNYRTYTEKSHNRIEKREYFLTADIEWFEDKGKWANLHSFICYDITTEDLVTGKKTKDRRYYISSLKDVELCADAIRGHWGVENQLHWHLDVNFSEDGNTTMDKNAFNNFSILNKLALTLYKLMQPAFKGYSIRSLRKALTLYSECMFTEMLRLFDEDILKSAMLNQVSK
jgi:predicted transposase YbfD/YdcC